MCYLFFVFFVFCFYLIFEDIIKSVISVFSILTGIDDRIYESKNDIIYRNTVLEWRMNHHDDLCVQYQYCKVGFSQSPDHKFVDCIYVLCKKAFKKAETKISKEKKTTPCDIFTSLYQKLKQKRWSAERAFEALENMHPLCMHV